MFYKKKNLHVHFCNRNQWNQDSNGNQKNVIWDILMYINEMYISVIHELKKWKWDIMSREDQQKQEILFWGLIEFSQHTENNLKKSKFGMLFVHVQRSTTLVRDASP